MAYSNEEVELSLYAKFHCSSWPRSSLTVCDGGGGVQTSYRVTPTWDMIGLYWVGSWVGLSQYCDHNITETLISRNTYCHDMSPTCYLCENMFLYQSVLELHMKRHEAPMYYFCTSCPECGKLFIWIVMWTNLLNDLCTLVILLIDVHV